MKKVHCSKNFFFCGIKQFLLSVKYSGGVFHFKSSYSWYKDGHAQINAIFVTSSGGIICISYYYFLV